MKWVALMPLRGGSRSIPSKNLRPLAGRPLFVWSLGAAVASGCRERAQLFERHLTALEGPLAADRIVDVLDARGRPPRPPLGRYLPAWISGNVRTTEKLIRMSWNHRSGAAFHTHRFSTLTVSDLESRIDRFRRLLGRFEGVRVTWLAPYVFRIVGNA